MLHMYRRKHTKTKENDINLNRIMTKLKNVYAI